MLSDSDLWAYAAKLMDQHGGAAVSRALAQMRMLAVSGHDEYAQALGVVVCRIRELQWGSPDWQQVSRPS